MSNHEIIVQEIAARDGKYYIAVRLDEINDKKEVYCISTSEGVEVYFTKEEIEIAYQLFKKLRQLNLPTEK